MRSIRQVFGHWRRILSHWGEVIRRSSSAFEQGELMAAVIAALLVFALGGALGSILSERLPSFMQSWSPWGFAVVVLFLWLFLVWTPARIWREQQDQIATLGSRIAPRIHVCADQQSRPTPDGREMYVRLLVENGGHEAVIDAEAKLKSLNPRGDARSQPLPEDDQNLMWSSRGGGEGFGPTRTVNPLSREYVDVALAQNGHFAFVDRFVDSQPVWLGNGEYELEIEVAAANVGTPTKCRLLLKYCGLLDLTIEDLP